MDAIPRDSVFSFGTFYDVNTLINVISRNEHKKRNLSQRNKKNSSPLNIMQIINTINDSQYEYLVTVQPCNKEDLCIYSCLEEQDCRHGSGKEYL